MNPGSKRELKIETPLAVLLTLAAWVYDQLGLPHSKAMGYVGWGICVALLFRILWISGTTLLSAANITFEEASALTWWRRQVIRYDVAGMHTYFEKLEIPVPDNIPPVTVHEGGQEIFNPPPHAYFGELRIPRQQVSDRKIVTHIYAVYVLQRAFPDPTLLPGFWEALPASAHQLNQTTFYSVGLREYFHASYWNSIEADNHGGSPSLVLWKIRESLGRRFSDRLAGRVFRVAVDLSHHISNPDMHVSFAHALKIADGLVESYEQSWPKIQRILDENPIKVGFVFRPANPNE